MPGSSSAGLEGFDPEAVAEIRQRLSAVKEQGIRIAFAIESGSRAWGFPSPDSDYDCRFVYVRPPLHHVALTPPRDVIEFPIIGDIDTGGWDLRKALLLALNGNAVLVEWLKSPLVYEENAGFRERLGILLDEIMAPEKVARHYVGLMHRHATSGGEQQVKLKKLLYAVRPAIALEWMRQNSFRKLPPMNMLECLAGITLAAETRQAIHDLVEVKKHTKEMGEDYPPAAIAAFLMHSFQQFSGFSSDAGQSAIDEAHARHLADKFYLHEVQLAG